MTFRWPYGQAAISCEENDREGESCEVADNRDHDAHDGLQDDGPEADFGEVQKTAGGDVVAGGVQGGRKNNSSPITIRTNEKVCTENNHPCKRHIHEAFVIPDERQYISDQNGSEEEGRFQKYANCKGGCIEEVIRVKVNRFETLYGRIHFPAEPMKAGEDENHAKGPDACKEKKWKTAPPQEPAGGWNYDYQTEPSGLAGGS